MTQTVPATAVLGPGKTGLTIGLRVLNLDGTTYAAFAATGVAETNIAGTYRKASGVVCPEAGAYIVWGTSVLDLAEATVEAGGESVSANDIADAVLLRDWTAITGTVPDRSTLQALRFLRNKWATVNSELTVYEEDGTTPAWVAVITTSSSADPVTGFNP